MFSLDAETEIKIKPEKIELDIIYEDNNVFVINKPCGMVVHPAAGNYTGTMAHGLLHLLENVESDFSNEDQRPGIVHRLDKDTSGLIIAAKNTKALDYLASQFKDRSTSKTYLAIIHGKLPVKKGTIKTLIGRDPNNRKKMSWKVKNGKEAVSVYRVLHEWNNYSLVVLELKTGRTHQLRVHMLSMGTPIAGDRIYSNTKMEFDLMLHAYRLSIKLPGESSFTGFRAPLPERFKEFMISLSNTD